MSISKNNLKLNLPILLLFVFTICLFPSKSQASPSYGWYIPYAEYVDDNLPPGCNPSTHASVEIWLVEEGTETLLTEPIGNWQINLLNEYLDINNTYNYNGQKKSARICFDPTKEFLQPFLDIPFVDNQDYLYFKAPSIMEAGPDPASMIGHHFKGYVQVFRGVMPNNPNSSFFSWWPGNDAYNTTDVEFELVPEKFDTLYGANSINFIRIYHEEHSGLDFLTALYPTSGGEYSTQKFTLPTLSAGFHYINMQMELNGSVSTTNGSETWTFENIPASGVDLGYCFVVDLTDPLSTVTDPVIISDQGSTVTISFDNIVSDSDAGLATTTLYVEDSTGTIVRTTVYQFVEGTSNSTVTDNPPGINKNETYTVYAITEDRAGNVGNSNVVSFNTGSGSTPTVTNLTANSISESSAVLGATITSDGGVTPITDAGFCWDDDVNFGSQECDSDSGSHASGTTYSLTPSSALPADSVIYYKAYATNAVGTAYSAPKSFNTLSQAPPGTGPVIINNGANNLSHDSANLRAEITSENGNPITNYGFCWNQGSTYDSSIDTCKNFTGGGLGSFSHTISGLLTPNETYSYIGYAENADANNNSLESTFTTDPPPIPVTTFDVTPLTIDSGDSVTLDWNSVNADTCVGTGPGFVTGGNTSGNLVLTPVSSVTYELDCSGPGGNTSDSFDVTVNSTPVLTDPELELTSPLSVVRAGDSIDLEWRMRNISEPMTCTLTGPSSLSGDPNATFSNMPYVPGPTHNTGTINTGILKSTQTFTLTCENDSDPTDTYSISAQVKVIGNSFEI